MFLTLKDERMQICEDTLNTHAFNTRVVVRHCSGSFVPYNKKIILSAEGSCFCHCRYMQPQAAEREFCRVQVPDESIQAEKMGPWRCKGSFWDIEGYSEKDAQKGYFLTVGEGVRFFILLL